MISVGNGLDISQVKEFYEPISDYIRKLCGISLEVKKAVDELNGQRVSIREAVDRISAVTNLVVFVNTNKNSICLQLKHSNDSEDSFRLIRFC